MNKNTKKKQARLYKKPRFKIAALSFTLLLLAISLLFPASFLAASEPATIDVQESENSEAQSEFVIPQASINTYTLSIHYQIFDELTQSYIEAAPPYIAQVAEGDSYSINSPIVEGYTPNEEALFGVMGNEDLELSINYLLDEEITIIPQEIMPPQTIESSPPPNNPEISNFSLQVKHQLVINYFYFDENNDNLQGSVAAQPYYGEYLQDESYSIQSPAAQGYSPSVHTVNGTMGSENFTIDVWYHKNNQNKYTVRHLFEKRDILGDYEENISYPLQVIQSLTGSTTAAASHNVSGFAAQSITQTPVAANGSTEVNVRYSRNSNYVYFSANGGTFVETILLRFEETASLPAAPTREGHTFAGWFTDAALTKAHLGTDVVMGPRDITFYAAWAPEMVDYTVQYWMETIEGQGEFEFSTHQTRSGLAGELTTLTEAELLSQKGLELKQIDNVVLAENGSSIVNAYFLRKTFSIEFYAASEVPGYGSEWQNSIPSTASYTITAKWGTNIADKWAELIAIHSGYRWVVSKTDPWANMTYGLITMPNFSTKYYGVPANPTSHQFYVHTYYESLDQTVGSGDASWSGLEFFTIPAEDGYFTATDHKIWLLGGNTNIVPGFSYTKNDLVNFDEDPSKKVHHASFYFKRKTLTITFNTRGGLPSITAVSARYESDISTMQPTAPTKAGHTFGGWYSNVATEGNPFDFNTMPANNTMLYAKWVPLIHEVKFEINDGSSAALSSQFVSHLERAQPPAAPSRQGYIFGGWHKTSAATGSQYIFDKPVSDDFTLYARWVSTRPVDYTVRYTKKDTGTAYIPSLFNFGDEGQTRMEEAFIDSSQKYVPDAASKSILLTSGQENIVEFIYHPFTQLSYKVEHRYADTGKLIPESILGLANPRIVTNSQNVRVVENYHSLPAYLPDKYQKIQLLANEITEADISENIIVFYYTPANGTEYLVHHYLEDPNATDEANKYYSSPEQIETLRAPTGSTVTASPRTINGHYYNAMGSVPTGTISSGEKLVLKLYYNINRHSVQFNSMGGSVVNSLHEVADGSLIKAPAAPTRQNHTFGGWFTSAQFAIAWNFDGDFVNRNITLYAQWVPAPLINPEPPTDPKTPITKPKLPIKPAPSTKPILPVNPAPAPPTPSSSAAASSSSRRSASRGITSSSSSTSSSEAPAPDEGSGNAVAFTNPVAVAANPETSLNMKENDQKSVIANDGIPLGGFTQKGVLSLINIILGVLGFLVAIVMTVRQLVNLSKNRKQASEKDPSVKKINQNRRTGVHWAVVGTGCLSALLFIILEDISMQLVLVNNWSILFIIITLAQVAAFVFGFTKKSKAEPTAEEQKT